MCMACKMKDSTYDSGTGFVAGFAIGILHLGEDFEVVFCAPHRQEILLLVQETKARQKPLPEINVPTDARHLVS